MNLQLQAKVEGYISRNTVMGFCSVKGLKGFKAFKQYAELKGLKYHKDLSAESIELENGKFYTKYQIGLTLVLF